MVWWAVVGDLAGVSRSAVRNRHVARSIRGFVSRLGTVPPPVADGVVVPPYGTEDQRCFFMTDMLPIAIDGALKLMDTDRRPWILGVAHLADISVDAPAFDAETIDSLLAVASRTVQFPSGPVDFVPGGYDQTLEEGFRLITFRSDAAPHLQQKIGLGVAGLVAVALTRSDVFDDGSVRPASVLLTDAESVVADTYILSLAVALELDYAGPIDFAFLIASDGPGEGLSVFAMDEETGKLVEVGSDGHRVGPTSGHIDYSPDQKTPQEAHREIHAMATDLLGRFGEEMQLVTLAERDEEGYADDPLDAHAPDRRSRARRG